MDVTVFEHNLDGRLEDREENKQEESEDEMDASLTMDGELGVLSKLQVMSASFIIQKQKETIS